MNTKYKRRQRSLSCILLIALFVSVLSGCSNGGAQDASAIANDAAITATVTTAPSAEATVTPTENTVPTPVQNVTPTPGLDTTPTPSDGKIPNTVPTKATTVTPTPTKKVTSTPAPTIAVSDKGTGSVVQNPSAPVPTDITPVASGGEVYTGEKAVIDASNKAQGYIMVKYTGGSSSKIKLRITVPKGTVYTYNLNNTGKYETFPLSGGNGDYLVKVYRNVSGTSYATEYSQAIKVTLKDQFAPFLHANQYVNYTSSSNAVRLASQLTSSCSSTLDKVQKVYNYVATNISYDYDKASTVASGYLPNIDNVLAKKKGICFDYAALMTAMLRSQKIPTQLVVGYANSAYHAWISVYISGKGWIDGVIYFDGASWKLMDPTFASTGGSEAITKTTYSAKYLY